MSKPAAKSQPKVNVSVSVVQLANVPLAEVVDLATRAFLHYPAWLYTFPTESTRAARLSWVFQGAIWMDVNMDEAHYVLLRDATSGRLVGAASTSLIPSATQGPRTDTLWAQLYGGMWKAPWYISLFELWRLKIVADSHTAVLLRDTRDLQEGYWFVREVSVDPELQGQGLGQKLMTELMRFSKEKKPVPLYLTTSTVKNVRFYQRLGFRVVSEQTMSSSTVKIWGMIHDGALPPRPAPTGSAMKQ